MWIYYQRRVRACPARERRKKKLFEGRKAATLGVDEKNPAKPQGKVAPSP